jgi:hypothetical protein
MFEPETTPTTQLNEIPELKIEETNSLKDIPREIQEIPEINTKVIEPQEIPELNPEEIKPQEKIIKMEEKSTITNNLNVNFQNLTIPTDKKISSGKQNCRELWGTILAMYILIIFHKKFKF